jgi:hypothetical protein
VKILPAIKTASSVIVLCFFHNLVYAACTNGHFRPSPDYNRNGIVDYSDLAIFRTYFGTANTKGDFDCNGIVNYTDLALFQAFFGQAYANTGLSPAQVGLVINDDDPNSAYIANYYQTSRQIPVANVVHVHLGTSSSVSQSTAAAAKTTIDQALGATIQALALAWTKPWRVESCNSITSVLSRGYDSSPCGATLGNANPYYNSASTTPFTTYGFRPSMMLAGVTTDHAVSVIDRGKASDGSLPVGTAHVMRTSDGTRSLRFTIFGNLVASNGLPGATYISSSPPSDDYTVTGRNYIQNSASTLFYFQGLANVDYVGLPIAGVTGYIPIPQQFPSVNDSFNPGNTFIPGAIADHLTSVGGALTEAENPNLQQMSCLQFLAAGATGSFGTVAEPYAISGKFPSPYHTMLYYTQGQTLVEAYWKSVQYPYQGVFVGDPLANPWMH